MILADKGFRVLLIDADPQMNLTAAMYGLSNSIEYSTDEDSKWTKNTHQYISLPEYLNVDLKGETATKELFRKEAREGYVDLISGSIKLSDVEADLYGIIKNRNQYTESLPYKFEQAIRKNNKNYDFILIDTSPSSSSIVNALIMMGTDYFVAPVAPSFFSLQAIDNLSSIFNNWVSLLSGYETTLGFKGLSFKPKFLGLVVQMAKRFNGGNANENITRFSKSAEKWIEELNESVKKFQRFALQRGMSITEDEFQQYFVDSTPFIIAKCCDFTPQLRSIAEKAGVPVVKLTQELCNKYKDSNTQVNITKEKGQYRLSLDSIVKSYGSVADGFIKLKK
jgi:chromosome partitioning protein